MKTFRASLQKDQSGIVSIMVTVIIILIVTLIVLGFARIVRREQRQALDRQLNTQAFYAAEAGINHAIKVLTDTGSPYTVNKPDCGLSPPEFASNLVDSTNPNIAYTCLLITQDPPTLEYDNVDVPRSLIVPVKSSNPADTISTITFTWQDNDGGSGVACPGVGSFPQGTPSAWPAACDAGILRVDLVPTDPTPLTRDNLMNDTTTAFLYPQNPGVASFPASSATGFGNQGLVWSASCTSTPAAGDKLCKTTITGLGRKSYIVRAKSIYKPNKLTIRATNSGGAVVGLAGAQAVVDSTGKAYDVLRRIQVRVPLYKAGNFPEDIGSVATLCKRMVVAPGIPPIIDSANPACIP